MSEDGPVARERVRRRLNGMDGREDGLPDERAVEQDFSIPADADFRSPGDADYATPGGHATGEELDEEKPTDRSATPPNPLQED